MNFLILGPNGSGKSALAEKIAVGLGEGAPLFYIATMIPYGEEGRIRVEKHRRLRADSGFVTVEKATGISNVTLPPNGLVLLEDVSNLLGNTLFIGDRQGGADSVFLEIKTLCGKCRAAVLVSIDGLAAGEEFDEETNGYINELNNLNAQLAAFADTVIVMREGKPLVVKGDSPLGLPSP
jgi:adenosylcobinamide kinase/adenosylcobinamide-phosphate guanylyltransferase